MTGWLYTFTTMAAFIALAAALEWRVTIRWYDHLIVAVLAALLLRPALSITGDISALLPDLWSSDADGKDQIILSSVAATLALPVMAASLLVCLGREVAGMWGDMKSSNHSSRS